MSAYDDIKRGVQEFVAPDLNQLKTRVGALEARMSSIEKAVGDADRRSEERDGALRQDTNRGLDGLKQDMNRGFDRVETVLNQLARQMRTEEEVRELHQRLALLEARFKEHSPAAQ